MAYRSIFAPGIMAAATCASADIVIVQGNNPLPGEENIVFPVGFLDDASLVQGRTSVTDFTIDFLGAGETLTTPDATQDRVVSADGGFKSLTIAPANGTVGSYTLNLTASTTGTVNLFVAEVGGSGVSGTFSLGNGNNFFTIQALAAGRISNISLTSTNDITSARSMKTSGMVVPEPATLLGLAAPVAGLLRRRRKQDGTVGFRA